MYLGPDVLKKVIENAEVYPIQGLFNFSHYFNEIDAYYHHTLGFELGVSTGWRGLNGLYNVSTIFHLCLDCFLNFVFNLPLAFSLLLKNTSNLSAP